MNIYDTPAWASGGPYYKNDVVQYNNLYYYALADNTDTNTPPASVYWGGVGTDRGETKPVFLWKPSYPSNFPNQPKVKTIQFGDGYTQDFEDGINNNLINADFIFDNRDLAEITAILHFFEARRGAESFLYTPPPPRHKVKRFKCKEWADRQNFYNNYAITAKFIEVVV